jgi:hypothetical protein
MHQVPNPCLVGKCLRDGPVLSSAVTEQVREHKHQRVTLDPRRCPKSRCAVVPDLDTRCRRKQSYVNIVNRQLGVAPQFV